MNSFDEFLFEWARVIYETYLKKDILIKLFFFGIPFLIYFLFVFLVWVVEIFKKDEKK